MITKPFALSLSKCECGLTSSPRTVSFYCALALAIAPRKMKSITVLKDTLSLIISDFTFADASIDECDVVQYMTDGIRGLLIGDKGAIRSFLSDEITQQGIDLQTTLRKNMKDLRPKAFVKQLMSIQRLVETAIGQLSERFHIENIRARDLWHLSNRFTRKLLAHTVGVFLNHCFGKNLLAFEVLVQM